MCLCGLTLHLLRSSRLVNIYFYLTSFDLWDVDEIIVVEVSEKELKCNYKTTTELSASSSIPMSPSAQKQHHQNGTDVKAATNGNSNSISNTTTTSTQSSKKAMSAAERSATKKSLVILAGIFVTSLAAMFYVYMIFPELNE